MGTKLAFSGTHESIQQFATCRGTFIDLKVLVSAGLLKFVFRNCVFIRTFIYSCSAFADPKRDLQFAH